MSFADELNSKVSEYNTRKEEAPDIRGFIDTRVIQYANDIRSLCTEQAEKGKRSLKGFFVPKRSTYYDEVTSESKAKVFDKPKKQINKKPTAGISSYAPDMYGGLVEVRDAVITLDDHEGVGIPKGILVNASMIERVHKGLIENLSHAGFKKLEIEHLTGPKYGVRNGLLGKTVVNQGTNHYFYVDIEW